MSKPALGSWSAAVALALGAVLYLAGRPTTLALFEWIDAVGLGAMVAGLREAIGPALAEAPAWIVFSLPFALWAFAFTALLRDDGWVRLVPLLAIGAELGQLIGVVPGTFDPTDLVLVAGFVALGWWIRVPEASSRSQWRPAAVSLAFVGIASGTLDESPEDKAAREAEQAKQAEGMKAYMGRLGQVHGKLSALSLGSATPKPCRDVAVQLPKEATGLRTVALSYLARFAGDPSTWKKNEGEWSFLTDSTFAGHFETHPDGREDYARRDTAERIEETFVPERYLVVIAPTGKDSAVLPVMHKDHFEDGSFEGWMFLVDQTDGTIACQEPFTVNSSDEIDFGGLLDSNDATKEMYEDFQDNFEGAIEAKLPKGIEISSAYGSIVR